MILNKIRFVALCIIISLLGIIFLLNVISSFCPLELIAKSIEMPITLVRNNDFLCTNISQIVADENHVYVLFGNYSVLQVYTLNGDYEYSVSVYNHMKGITSIATHNNSLYICDKIDNVYVFSNGELSEFIDRTQSLSIRRKLPFGASSSEYRVHLASVWYAPGGELSKCVIQRPAWLAIFQNNLLFILQFTLIVFAGAILLFFRKQKPIL